MATEDSVGTRIAKRRHQLRLSQGQLAERLGVSRSTVANWERGKHYPLRHLGALEQILRFTLTGGGSDGETYTDPDELTIWNLTGYSPDERRRMIAALRASRRESA